MLISRGTAPKQPVEWTHSPKMAKQIFTNFNKNSKHFIKFVNFNEFDNQKSRILELCTYQYVVQL